MPTSFRRPVLSLTVIFAALCLQAGPAGAFRIIASSSGSAGIAQAPCCDTGFDGGFELSTIPTETVMAAGSQGFLVPSTTTVGTFAGVALSGEARAAREDIGARATVDLTGWDPAFTGETIEVFSSALLEDTFSPIVSSDLYIRPVFALDGSVSHAGGLVSTLTFNMRATLPGASVPSDNILFQIDGGTPGSMAVFDESVVGPDLFIAAGSSLFLSLRLSAQVSGTPDDIPAGDQFGEVDASNTLSLVGFETYSDPGYSVPVVVEFTSESGRTLASVPEPSTALLLGLGVGALGARRRA